jgi:hypothetical protein
MNSTMEINENGTFFQEGDHVRIKRTGEQGRIDAADGGVVYVLMHTTNETKIFSAAIDEDAYIELVTVEVSEASATPTPALKSKRAE